jgi:hypothetical protein
MMDKKMSLEQVSDEIRPYRGASDTWIEVRAADLELWADAIDAEIKARGEPVGYVTDNFLEMVRDPDCGIGMVQRLQTDRASRPVFFAPHAPKITNEALVKLARRCLWLAYVWNDHNFDAAHVCARKTAEDVGIESFEEANTWLQALKEAP